MSDKVWLTFMNQGMSEEEVRLEFKEYGPVEECDGAVGGEGWVMVALGSKEKAVTAVKEMKEKEGSKVGSSITLMEDMMSSSDEKMEQEDSDVKDKDLARESSSDLRVSVVKTDHDLLSRDMKDAASTGLSQFTKINAKILELVSHNNVLLLERTREVEEQCSKQLREKDDQIKRLQNLLTTKDDHLKKLTVRLSASTDFEEKAKKFFGDNEDFYKKKVEDMSKANKELTVKLGESEARRMENLLEEADTSKIRDAVTGLASITEDIQSKTEQVWAVVQGMDGGVSLSGAGETRSFISILTYKARLCVRPCVSVSFSYLCIVKSSKKFHCKKRWNMILPRFKGAHRAYWKVSQKYF